MKFLIRVVLVSFFGLQAIFLGSHVPELSKSALVLWLNGVLGTWVYSVVVGTYFVLIFINSLAAVAGMFIKLEEKAEKPVRNRGNEIITV